MKIKQGKASRLFDIFNTIFLFMVTVMCLYPFLFVLFASFSNPNGLAKHSGVLLAPVGFSLESYQQVLSNNNIWRGYGNTICYVIVGVGINMVMTTMSAYALSRRNFKTRNILMLMVVFAMIFKGGSINVANFGRFIFLLRNLRYADSGPLDTPIPAETDVGLHDGNHDQDSLSSLHLRHLMGCKKVLAFLS